jgi:uncharacterized protein
MRRSPSRLRRFFLVLYALTAASHLPFTIGLAFVLARAGVPGNVWIAIAIAAALASLVRGRVRRARDDEPIAAWRLAFVEEPYYAHWAGCIGSLLIFSPLALIAWGALRIAGHPIPPGALAAGTYVAGVALAAWGVFGRRHLVRIKTIPIAIPGLGASFEGYRIAQLSDLHIGGLWPRHRALGWARRLAELDADLVALTGDYVTSGTAFHDDIAATLSAMRGKDGAIAVMGNHDYFGDGEPLVTLLRARGVLLLRNENVELRRGDDRLTVVGVDDTWTRRADVDRAVAGRDTSIPMVALAHDPQLFPKLADAGASLVLSGHTHWGQIALPFFSTRFNLSRVSYRYHAGIYKQGDATLYVHPGLGTTGPPIRVGAAPEITVLVLRSA